MDRTAREIQSHPAIIAYKQSRPIDDVNSTLRAMKNTIDTIMIDNQVIKSDLKVILDLLKTHAKQEEEKKTNISKGWWIY
jgi:hypothetical protein